MIKEPLSYAARVEWEGVGREPEKPDDSTTNQLEELKTNLSLSRVYNPHL